MSFQPEIFPRLVPVGEAAVLIELGEDLNGDIHRQVFALDDWLRQFPLDGVLAQVPGYCSILVSYDPQQLTFQGVAGWLEERLHSCPKIGRWKPRRVEVPVRYGGEDGPDLGEVAHLHKMSPEEVVRRHTEPLYTVGMMGFTPGFAYLIGLAPELETPRLTNPRTLVPAGSVGIAGAQTGIYPLDSPGGWQLIGRTDLRLFNPQSEPFFLFSPGDEVRFVAVEGGAIR